MDLLARTAEGFQSVDADAALKAKALDNLRTWLTHDDFAAYRPQLEWLAGAGKWSELLDAFYQVLPFGTGGRRGSVGVGPNRMNPWTVSASVQGHCEYLREKFPEVRELHVVIAYDVRQFEDKKEVYNPDLPNPVLHLSSKNLAHHAARVYAANGVHAHLLPPDSKRFVATPELSFTIRHLAAHGGLNLTASHNPPDDNGSKFYDERGGQPVPPDDQIMSDLVDQVAAIKSLGWADAVRAGRIHFLDDGPHKAYIELCRKQSLVPPPKLDEVTVVFTPLHGVGSQMALEVLIDQGFRPVPVESQMTPDGQFPNVTKSPNPEVPESMDRAAEVAREHDADLVLSTDPDADRVGAMVADGRGGLRFVTGNEICALVTYFKLDQLTKQGVMPRSPVTVTTEVTTTLVTRVARAHGSQVVNNLLVGFKYIAEVLRQLERYGAYEDVTGTPEDYILGCEESHGIMATAGFRDKDSAAACLLMAELMLDLKRQGKTVPQLLAELAERFGYFRNEVLNLVMTGIEGKGNMARMLDRLRAEPPKEIGGLAVTAFEDLRDPEGRMGPIKGATDAASRNVLIFRMGDARSESDRVTARVVLRPSGTEPKAKAYVEVCSGPRPAGMTDDDWAAQQRAIDAQTQRLATEFLRTAMGTVGLTPAAGADKLSR